MVNTWRKKVVDKWRTLWTKGGNKKFPAKTRDWVMVTKTSLIGEWEVGAKRVINTKTNNKHFKYFQSKTAALAFARAYMRKH
jgi:hypothetical protein